MARYYAGKRPMLCGFSKVVCPLPADWPQWHEVTGYWQPSLDASYRPDLALEAFLASGPPPIYIGFGSMRDEHPEALTAAIVAVAKQSAYRFVLQRGWAGLGEAVLPSNVYLIDQVPHEWLFPRMFLIVHHGGAGTTAAALRAGVPSLVVPFGLDQPFWARRVVAVGAGGILPFARLNADSLSLAIARVAADSKARSAAIEVQRRLAAEEGLGKALRFVESQSRGQSACNRK